ncbi:chemotaxis protein CheD [Haloplanus halophilus]|uniref:chemotaxis protein CheD n=1 Tax=Haloplanus halophilus TaxID=2949993 RepID=UPI00203CF801|nr:chemotaxis protein CheD [Haloplanus sp. GDY1]
MKTYGREASDERTRRRVGIADFAVTADGAVLTTSGLGSCLGVGLFDESAGVAGLAHTMLPTAPDDAANAAKFTDTGIDAAVNAMCREGAAPGSITAKLAGGSAMFEFDSQEEPIGRRNVEVGRRVLERLDVPVVAEDVGGDSGRSLRFHGDTGVLVVKSAGDEREL